MKNMKFWRTALVAALVLTVMLSVTGGTIAWFTDTVESKDNIIASGTLDVEMSVYDADEAKWVDVEKLDEPIFNYTLWEPGYAEYKYVKIANNGNLAFKYDLDIIPNGAAGILAEVIDVYFADKDIDVTKKLSRTDVAAMTNVGTLNNVIGEQVAANGVLLPVGKVPQAENEVAGEVVLCIALKMQESADNAYQNQSIGTDFDIQLLATQYTYEKDAFDNTYDADAEYVMLPKAKMTELTGDDLAVVGSDDFGATWNGLTFLTGKLDLDCGVKFEATEEPEDLVNKEYGDWIVDFELSSTKALAETDMDKLALAGHYDFMSLAETNEWLAFKVEGVAVPANTSTRLLQGLMKMKYNEIVAGVKEFMCGVIADDDFFAGESITVRLCVYETDGHGNEIENGRHVIDNYTYTFGE